MANLRFIEDYSSVEELFEELQCHNHQTLVYAQRSFYQSKESIPQMPVEWQ